MGKIQTEFPKSGIFPQSGIGKGITFFGRLTFSRG